MVPAAMGAVDGIGALSLDHTKQTNKTFGKNNKTKQTTKQLAK